jgi:hypothetical protein
LFNTHGVPPPTNFAAFVDAVTSVVPVKQVQDEQHEADEDDAVVPSEDEFQSDDEAATRHVKLPHAKGKHDRAERLRKRTAAPKRAAGQVASTSGSVPSSEPSTAEHIQTVVETDAPNGEVTVAVDIDVPVRRPAVQIFPVRTEDQ